MNVQEEIITLDLEKPHAGGLGFSVIGGERGIFVKSITPGGVAESSSKLQVGDRLLKVSDVWHFMLRIQGHINKSTFKLSNKWNTMFDYCYIIVMLY